MNLHSFYLAFVIYFHANSPSWLIWYQRLLIWEQHLKLLFSRALLKRVYRPFRDTFHSFLNIWKFSLKNLVSCYLLSFSLFAVTLGPILRWNHFWDSQCRDSQSHNAHSEREVDLTRNYGYFESSRLGGEVERLLWWLRAGVGTKQMTFQWQFSNSGIHLFRVMTLGIKKYTWNKNKWLFNGNLLILESTCFKSWQVHNLFMSSPEFYKAVTRDVPNK